MGINILKNTGRIILSILIVFISIRLYAIEVETELTPSRIAVGESASLRIKVTGSSSINPVKLSAVTGVQISYSGTSRSFQIINGKKWSGTVLSYSVTADKKGEYKIPPFVFEADGEKFSSREVVLSVRESSGSNGNSVNTQLRADVEISSDTVYTGEPLIMRYVIYNGDGDSPQIEGFSEKPEVKGFVMKALDEKNQEQGKTFAGSFCMVPVDKGVHDVGGGTLEVIIEVQNGFFSMGARRRITFPTKKITVLPIPVNGKTENFTGDVGEFKIEAVIPSGNFRMFEEIKIPVKISGRGNLITLSKPQIGNIDGIKTVVEEKEQTLSVTGGILSGEKNFMITVIPGKEGTVNPGRIFIEYFNPYKKSYERAESNPLSFVIQKGEGVTDKGEVSFSSDASSGNKLNYIYAALILSALAVSVIILVLWEKKKFRMIKNELEGDAPAAVESPVINRNDDILKKLHNSMNDKNSDMFLHNADRAISQIDQSKLPASEMIKYNLFKEKIYFCRYGGGSFEEAEMNELSQWLKRFLK